MDQKNNFQKQALALATGFHKDSSLPLLHLFRNVVPAPFSSFAWRHYDTEHVRLAVKPVRHQAQFPLLSLLSLMFSETGASVYTRRRTRARRWQCIMAYCFFALLLCEPQDDGTISSAQNWLFFAFALSVVTFLRVQHDVTSCLYGENMAEAHAEAGMGLLAGMPYSSIAGATGVVCAAAFASSSPGSGSAHWFLFLFSVYVIIATAADANLFAEQLDVGEVGGSDRYLVSNVVRNKATYKNVKNALRKADKQSTDEFKRAVTSATPQLLTRVES